MQVLFVHQNFPGQYKHLAPALAARGHRVDALCINAAAAVPGVTVHRYQVKRGTTRDIHPWVGETETKVLRGEACAQAALVLRESGFMPDVICAHPGWGEALFLREVWPDAKQLHYVEFHYAPDGLDVGFDPEFGGADFAGRCRIRMKNANNLLNLDRMDRGLSPTAWQRSTVPAPYRDRIEVVHDGIDTAKVRPDASARLELAGEDGVARVFAAGEEIVTFVNRNLEPSRGYHTFMRALPDLLARRPAAQILIVGGAGVSYGAKPAEGSYKERYLAEVADRIDPGRVHFLGRVPYEKYLKLLQVSAAHVYLTYPFVLSWSMLEAMSAGCLVIGSRTPPVEEALADGVNGLLVDFFSPQQIVDAVCRVLDHPDRMQALRAAARQSIIERYDLFAQCLPRQIALVEGLAAATPGCAPDKVDALHARALAAQSRGQFQEADAAYRQVLAVAPNHLAANSGLAALLQRSGRREEALAYYRKAVELDPRNARLNYSLGYLLLRLGDPRAAMPHLELAAAATPTIALAEKLAGYARFLLAGKDVAQFELDGEPVRFRVVGNNLGLDIFHVSGHFFEEPELAYCREILAPGGVIVDVGANVGNHLVYFAKALAPARIFPIEPNPDAVRLLRDNIELNGIGCVDDRYLGIGVGQSRARVALSMPRQGDLVVAQLVPDAAGTIEVWPLDELQFERIDLLKVDVEGMEFEVLGGMKQTLARHRPVVMMEVQDGHHDRFVAAMHGLGYTVMREFAGAGYANLLLKAS